MMNVNLVADDRGVVAGIKMGLRERQSAVERLMEVCQHIEARLFFSKKIEPDTIYYKSADNVVITDRHVSHDRVNDFMRKIRLGSD